MRRRTSRRFERADQTMATKLGKIRFVCVMVIMMGGSMAVQNTAFGQDQSSRPKTLAVSPANSTQGINQRLQELARDGAGESGSRMIGDYRIGAEDLLEVSVYGAPDLSQTVRVSSDGWISLPLAGNVHAEGQTARELEGEIEGLLEKDYMKHPQVNVFLKEIQSHPVSVIGAVGKPGVFQIRGEKSLIEVLSMAQGLADDAGDSVIVMRRNGANSVASASLPPLDDSHAAPDSNSKSGTLVAASFSNSSTVANHESLQINLKDLLTSADSRFNIAVYPGDVVKVPPAGIVYVVGQVRKPGGFLLKTNENLSVLQALALAEGTTSTSAGKNARIIRMENASGDKKEIPINLNRILAGKSPDLTLQAKDILFIPNSAGKSAFYRGAQAALTITGGLIVYRW